MKDPSQSPNATTEQDSLISPPTNDRKIMVSGGTANLWWQIALAGALALILGIGTLQALVLFAHSLALLVLAICIAAALSPAVACLERWLPRGLAIAVVYLILVLFFVALGQLTIPTLVLQAQRIGDRAPELVGQAAERLAGLGMDSSSLFNAVTPQLGGVSSAVVSLPLSLVSSLLEIFLVLVVSIYWLLVAVRLRNFFVSLFPSERRGDLNAIMHDIGYAMGGYIRGAAINGLTMGFLTFLGLSVIGVEFPLVLGVLTGLLELVPVVGPMIAGVMVVGVAFLQSPTLAVIALIYMFLLQQFESHLLVPNIMRSQTEISPLLAILALFAGSAIGGLLGALIAIPIAAVTQVLVTEVVVPQIRRRTGAVVHEQV